MRKLLLFLTVLAFVGCGGGEEAADVAPAPSEPAARNGRLGFRLYIGFPHLAELDMRP